MLRIRCHKGLIGLLRGVWRPPLQACFRSQGGSGDGASPVGQPCGGATSVDVGPSTLRRPTPGHPGARFGAGRPPGTGRSNSPLRCGSRANPHHGGPFSPPAPRFTTQPQHSPSANHPSPIHSGPTAIGCGQCG